MATKFGKYAIKERLGGGGMAEVFRAVLTGPGGFEKHLALKLILPQFSDDDEFVRMFIHEATLAAVLDHANIVRIHEFDQVDGRYYIAMELVDGKDLRAVLAQARKLGRRLKIAEAALLSVEISRGLSFAHGELTPGAPVVIHRDISPHNVILSRAGEVKITDFGIAKLSSSASFTKTGVVKGKLAYMSPEQASGIKLDKRSDLFSLGCVMWELLTGQRLFRAKNDMEALNMLKEDPISPPSTHNPDIPPELDQLVLGCLVRDREKRQDSASEICNELDAVCRKLVITDRATALAGLFRELFGTVTARKSTAILSAADMAPDVIGAEDRKDFCDENAPEIELVAEKSRIGSGLVEPVGPENETVMDSVLMGKMQHADRSSGGGQKLNGRPVSETDPGSKSGLVASVLIGLMVAGIVVVVAFLWAWLEGRGYLGEDETHTRNVKRQTGDARTGTEQGRDEHGRDGGTPGSTVGQVQTGQLGRRAGLTNARTATDAAGDGRAGVYREADGGTNTAAEEIRRDGDSGTIQDPVKTKPVGYLNLNVIPWAKVYKGRRFLGVTPLEHLPLVPGKHRLTLRNDELGARLHIDVLIRRGMSTTQLVKLR